MENLARISALCISRIATGFRKWRLKSKACGSPEFRYRKKSLVELPHRLKQPYLPGLNFQDPTFYLNRQFLKLFNKTRKNEEEIIALVQRASQYIQIFRRFLLAEFSPHTLLIETT